MAIAFNRDGMPRAARRNGYIEVESKPMYMTDLEWLHADYVVYSANHAPSESIWMIPGTWRDELQ